MVKLSGEADHYDPESFRGWAIPSPSERSIHLVGAFKQRGLSDEVHPDDPDTHRLEPDPTFVILD
jgi:hypothetical protein